MYRITSKFKDRESFRNHDHNGLDIAMPSGTELKAVEGGTIHLADYGATNAGKTVFIETTDGHKIIYGHLSEFKVTEGQHVNVGDTVALSGNSGHSTGAHLHLGLKNEHNQFINPDRYVAKDGSLNLANAQMPSTDDCNVFDKLDAGNIFDKGMSQFSEALQGMTVHFIDFIQPTLQFAIHKGLLILDLILLW